jgi:hypothetical protein
MSQKDDIVQSIIFAGAGILLGTVIANAASGSQAEEK